MAGGAWASELDIAAAGAVAVDADTDAAVGGPYVVGSEWLAGQIGVVNVDLALAVPSPGVAAALRSDILYTPSIDLGVNSTLVITVTNGAIAPSTTYGLWRVAGGAALVGDMVDFTADTNGNYTSMTFKIIVPTVVTNVLAFTENSLVPGAANRPELRFTAVQLAAGNMTLQVTAAYDDTSLPLAAPLTAPEVVAKRAAQLSAKVQYVSAAGPVYTDGNATSVIDVEATPVSRSKFVVEAGLDTPTTTTSTAAILVVATTVNNGIVVANAAYNITLNGDQTSIISTTGVTLEGTNFTRGTNQWTLASTFAAHDLTAAGSNDIIITVGGTTVIDVATYTVDLVIDPAEAGVANQQSLDDATAFVWTVNAMQARVPYIIVETGGANYTFFMEITNRGSQAAQLSLDAVISNADATVNTTETVNNVLTVPANSVTIIREADLDTWLTNVDDTQLYRLGLTLTVVAPQNTVDVSAYQLDSTGRTVVPVLYNTNNSNDGRLWQ
jgi:hypothetical protein